MKISLGSIPFLLVVGVLVSACGATSPDESVYDQVRDDGVVRVGIRFDNPCDNSTRLLREALRHASERGRVALAS